MRLLDESHLIVNESSEVSLVTEELDHDELVALVAGQGEQERVELREPLRHRVVGLLRDDRRHTILGGEVIAPDLLYLLGSLLGEEVQLDDGVQGLLLARRSFRYSLQLLLGSSWQRKLLWCGGLRFPCIGLGLNPREKLFRILPERRNVTGQLQSHILLTSVAWQSSPHTYQSRDSSAVPPSVPY